MQPAVLVMVRLVAMSHTQIQLHLPVPLLVKAFLLVLPVFSTLPTRQPNATAATSSSSATASRDRDRDRDLLSLQIMHLLLHHPALLVLLVLNSRALCRRLLLCYGGCTHSSAGPGLCISVRTFAERISSILVHRQLRIMAAAACTCEGLVAAVLRLPSVIARPPCTVVLGQ